MKKSLDLFEQTETVSEEEHELGNPSNSKTTGLSFRVREIARNTNACLHNPRRVLFRGSVHKGGTLQFRLAQA